MFNILNSALAVVIAPIYLKLLPLTAESLVRQTANAHTAVMIVGAALVLPLAPLYARFICALVPSRLPPPQPSFLDQKLIPYPEKALYAAILELQRVARICVRSLWLTADVIFQPKRKEVQTIKLNENVVDEIKKAMKSYLARLAERALSRRQAILVQTINRCMADVERIGDHIDEVCDISIRRKRAPLARFNRETLAVLMDLHEGAAKVLHLVIESLNPESADFQAMAQAILQARDEYTEKSINAKAFFTEKIANHEYPPIAGVYFSEYVAAFDRIVKHSKSIALAEKQPFFWIKRKKLEQMVTEAPHYQPVTLSDPKDFLDKLHQENYL